MQRSAIDRHSTSLKMSFEVTTVAAFCDARRSSRCAASSPRRNGTGLGGSGKPQPIEAQNAAPALAVQSVIGQDRPVRAEGAVDAAVPLPLDAPHLEQIGEIAVE